MTDEKVNLVSIIIPCYNQEKWVAEAIDSALSQTYPHKEVIVVDDGSTDSSLNVIKRYGESIKIIEMPHQNGNYARNEGFRVSKGAFIQFLDADDYILSEKISKQVQAIKNNKYDVVYGDWKHIYSFENKKKYFGDEKHESLKKDYIAELMKGWWVAPVALLWSRSIVNAISGWDVTIEVAQDRDFFLSAAIEGAKIGYVEGCDSIYRRHSHLTVSTRNKMEWLENHGKVLQKAEKKLFEDNKLSEDYKKSLAVGYFKLARLYFGIDREEWMQIYKKVCDLDSEFMPQESWLYNSVYKTFGVQIAEKSGLLKRKIFHV